MITVTEAARRRGLEPHLLAALERVPRAAFVSPEVQARATFDEPLPIGGGHHHAEPSYLAVLLSLAGVGPGRSLAVLGAGTGYLAALAAAAGAEVVAVERDPAMAARARAVLSGVAPTVSVVEDDAFRWVPGRTFDAIVLAGAVQRAGPWLEALAPSGVLVAPIGDARRQELVSFSLDDLGKVRRRGHGAVRFALLIR